MTETITLQEAQAHLAELIAGLVAGEEVIITQDDRPVAKLIAERSPARQPRQPGSAIGKLIVHAEDNEHLEDFKEYMP
ncbi:MAG: type II toxin-antitoxin system prevent-host-death family antitoxin [Acidobacteria bacterium]|nr:type II toxin-antitoxin system prevent-host-death family antitoxin [Acidobacteriota bacterium]